MSLEGIRCSSWPNQLTVCGASQSIFGHISDQNRILAESTHKMGTQNCDKLEILGREEMLCVVLQWCLVYSILGSMTRENWRSSLYSYSTQQVLTVTRLHTVVKLVHAMPNYNRMPFVATSCCKKSSSLKYHTGEFVTYLMQQPVIFIGVYWSIKNHVISI